MSNVVALVEEATLDDDLVLAVDKTVLHPTSNDSSESPKSSSLSRNDSGGGGGNGNNSGGSGSSTNTAKSDYHLVGGKIRPTLKCIRNTLARGKVGGDSSKRYDRLSSSRSNLHLDDENDKEEDNDFLVVDDTNADNVGEDSENIENYDTLTTPTIINAVGGNKRKELSNERTVITTVTTTNLNTANNNNNGGGNNKLKKMISEGAKCDSINSNLDVNGKQPQQHQHQQQQPPPQQQASGSSSTTTFVAGGSGMRTGSAVAKLIINGAVNSSVIVTQSQASISIVEGSCNINNNNNISNVNSKSSSNNLYHYAGTTATSDSGSDTTTTTTTTSRTNTVDIVAANHHHSSFSPSAVVNASSSSASSHSASLLLPAIQLPSTQTFRGFIKTRTRTTTTNTTTITTATARATAATVIPTTTTSSTNGGGVALEPPNGSSTNETLRRDKLTIEEGESDIGDQAGGGGGRSRMHGLRLSRPKHHASTCSSSSSNSTSNLVKSERFRSSNSTTQLVMNETSSSLANPCHMAIYEHVDDDGLRGKTTVPATNTSSSKHNKPPPAFLPTKSRTLLPSMLKPNRFTRHVKNSGRSNSSGNLLFSGWAHHHLHRKAAAAGKEVKRASVDNLYIDTNSQVQDSLKWERMLPLEPGEERRRRTILIEKQNGSFGFTLQTYGIKNAKEGEVELITYVDEVKYGGPAFRGGMRPGDVILSINGRDVEKADHQTMVTMINACEHSMRLVVLFEDCVRKIELHIKYLKAKSALKQKLAELDVLEQRERQILLNAALRRCKLEEDKKTMMIDESATKVELDSERDEAERVKLHKCKSLNASLDDVNCNQINTTASTTAATTPTEQQQPIEVNNNKKKLNHIKSASDIVEDDEEHLVDDERDCLEHWKVGGSKCRGGLKMTIKDEEIKSSSVPVSKSLPHSIANSLDCLTNEAYEDDEDELIKNSGETYYPPNIAPVTKSHDTGHPITATGDKDFITKL